MISCVDMKHFKNKANMKQESHQCVILLTLEQYVTLRVWH